MHYRILDNEREEYRKRFDNSLGVDLESSENDSVKLDLDWNINCYNLADLVLVNIQDFLQVF